MSRAFAAASIGQVHRATTEDGDAVVVKVQYPGVAEAVETDLRNAILRLGPRDRAVVTLHYFLDLPLEEVAAVTRQSVSAVRSQLYRALHRMRPSLEIQEGLR